MSETFGFQFQNDPRIHEAKRLLKEALMEYQSQLVQAAGSNTKLADQYQQWLKDVGDMRGRDLFFPYLSSGLGRGPLVELADGSVKYDFISGIGVHGMGHGHEALLEAAIDGALEDTIMQGNLQQGMIAKDVMSLFLCAAGGNESRIKHCFLTSSGAMANENAFKIIFQKHAPANRFLAFHRCFTGRTMATAQMTDKPAYRQGLPKTIEVDYIPFYDHTRHEESIQESVNALSILINEHPGKYAGMCMELIQGEGGYYPGHSDFFQAIIRILKKHNIAVMVDEVQSFGRTSHAFAFQYFNLQSLVDVVTVGKMSQVCATLYSHEYNPQAGLLSQTFTSSSSALHAARCVLDKLLTEDYLGEHGTIMRISQYFRNHLIELAQVCPDDVSGPFGIGGMVAFTYRKGDRKETLDFLMRMYHNGVLGFVAGADPVRVRFLIPVMNMSESDVDAAVDIIQRSLREE